MRETELRRLFLGLAAAATPVGLTAAGCGGVAEDRSGKANLEASGGYPHMAGYGDADAEPGDRARDGAPPPTYVGRRGTGGYPFTPGTGGYPNTGGYPFVTGAGGAPNTGGYPYPPGMGGSLPIPPVVDAAVQPPLDSGPDGGNFCMTSTPPGCEVVCVPVGLGSDIGNGRCMEWCAEPAHAALNCEPVITADQNWVRCFLGCARRPEGLVDPSLSGDNAVRAYFQEMSRLEAASVPAFRVLARELRAHGAPRSLIRAARRAARDEVRHARMGTLLAERFGGRYVRPSIATQPVRSIEAIATDNAAEGCVRETFGALLATWQGRAATDPVVRRIMRRVAVDETRHAALNLRVAAWADRQMDAAARARVRAARRAAAERVLSESSYEPSDALVAIAGVPRSHDARRLAVAMTEHLWS